MKYLCADSSSTNDFHFVADSGLRSEGAFDVLRAIGKYYTRGINISFKYNTKVDRHLLPGEFLE